MFLDENVHQGLPDVLIQVDMDLNTISSVINFVNLSKSVKICELCFPKL